MTYFTSQLGISVQNNDHYNIRIYFKTILTTHIVS